MKQPYPLPLPGTRSRLLTGSVRLLGLLLLLALLPWMAWAQAPTITAVAPVPNLRNAARTNPVQVSFSQPLTAGSTAALKVYSAQRGGLRTLGTTPAVVSGSTLSYTPPVSRPWLPGETVYSTVTTAAASSGGSLAQARVTQFTAAAGGTGVGNFLPGTDLYVNRGVSAVAVADMNGDGSLDVVYASVNGGFLVTNPNNGSGTISNGPALAVGTYPNALATADVDGDGNLDVLTTDGNATTVNVSLNDGSGTLSSGPAVTVGSNPYSVAVGDVDGDGDLDLLAANVGTNTVSVRLNNGSGTFGGGSEVAVGGNPHSVAVGDVDGDGDLDLLTANSANSTVSVRLNNGSGTFGGGSDVAVGDNPSGVAVGDVDGDGDLDLLTANTGFSTVPTNNTVSVRLNNGSGTFGGGSTVAVGVNPVAVTLGDVDADGDLDLVAANQGYNTASVRLNNGSGTFGGGSEVTSPGGIVSVTLGDIDGDGDLDLLLGNQSETALSVLLNQPPAPTISSFTPTSGPVGSTVTITGTNLGTATSVSFNGTLQTTFTSVSTTQLVLTVPAGATTGRLTVTTPSGTSPASSQTFTVLPPPVITGFTPGSGLVGTTVTITGTGLTGATSVSFNGTPQTTFASSSATQIVLAVPAGATTGPLTVTAFGVPGPASSQVFYLPPTISSFTPTSGSEYTTVTITGTNFTGAASVSFNGTPQTSFYSVTATQLTLYVPVGATTGPLTVTTPGGTSPASAQPFSVTPVISSFTPTSGPVGTTVAITGTNLGTATSVSFNGTLQTTFTSVSNTQIVLTVPVGATTGALTATSPIGTGPTSAQNFTVLPPPTISSFTPGSGPVGTTVTITGTNFTGATSVSFNGTAQTTFTSVTATRIVLTVPAGATTGRLTVTTASGTSAVSTQTFYLPPVISSFTPTSGPVGTSVTITGTNFTGATTVRFNGTTQLTFTSVSATQIVLNVPANATTGPLTVTTPGGTSPASAQPFSVTPVISSFTPTSGPEGTTVTITGTNLTGATSVSFNGTLQTTFTSVTATRIVLTVPANTTTGPLTVTTASGTSAVSSQTFIVVAPPVISSFTPNSGPVGTMVTVTGTNLTGATSVNFNGTPQTFFQSRSATQLVINVPNGATTGPLTVSIPGFTSAPSSQVFSLPPAISYFTPDTGPEGTTVTIVGTDLAGTTSVSFNGTDQTTFTSVSATEIVLTVPVGATTGTLTATSPIGAGPASAQEFTVVPPPTISSFSPGGGAVGTTVNIYGSYLDQATSVSFNGTDQTAFSFVSFYQLTLTVPAGATTGPLTVSIPGFTSPPSSQSFYVQPIIASFTPTSGAAGTPVVLTGTNLTGATRVTVNGVLVTPTNVTSTSLRFVVPAGGNNTQRVTVTNPFVVSPISTAFTVRLQAAATGTLPLPNARTAARTSSALAVGFTEPVTQASAAALRVFSAQAGGRKAGTVTMSGSTASYTSSLGAALRDFRPGEVVSVSVPATVLGVGGLATTKRVYQFTTAVSQAGSGTYLPGSAPAVGTTPYGVALGDVDGDGDLDLVSANSGTNNVTVALNGGDNLGTNTGTFSNGSTVTVGTAPRSVVLGDVDGDGDLDVLTANSGSANVSVLINGGTNTGVFTALTPVAVGTSTSPQSVVLGDVDGDGDLDFVTTNFTSSNASVRLNGGTGVFSGSGTITLAAGAGPQGGALGDVDGDGDLDFVVANYSLGTAFVRLNGGNNLGTNTGTFSAGSTVTVGTNPQSVGLADVDGDGDLDLAVANAGSASVSMRLNGGDNLGTNTGAFSNGSTVTMGTTPYSVALGDVDGDGDLDLLAANAGSASVSVRLNGGDNLGTNTGTFSAGTDPAVGTTPYGLALGDVDGDGDLDLLTANAGSASVSVRLNQPPPVITSLTPNSGPVGTSVTIAGTNLGTGTSVSFNGTPQTTFTSISATQIVLAVPTGTTTGLVTVTTPNGTSNGLTFTVVNCQVAALTQATTLTLAADGTATLTAAQVNNGSSGCGAVTLSVSPGSFTCANLGANAVTLTVTDANGNSATAPATVTVSAPALTSTTWTGTAGTDPADCANWSYGQLPTATISAVIPAGLASYPVLTSGTMAVNDLTLDAGSRLTVASGAALQVSGSFTNNGTANLAGPVAFVGSTATQTLGGSTATSFANVTVNKPAGTVQLAQSPTVDAALTLTAGTLTTTSSYQINLGSAATLSETDASYVLGTVAVGRPLVPGTAEAFGGLGLTLTPAAGSTAPGATTVVRTTGTVLTGVGTSVSVKRYFDIQPAVNTGLDVTMAFAYFNHELNGIAATNLALFKSVTTTAGPWANQGVVTLGTNTVTRAGIRDFSIWTLGNKAAPLPVELSAFTATPVNNAAVHLAWTTASERNSARFEVERSTDGRTFTAIGTVAAAGSSNTARRYELLDHQVPKTPSPQDPIYYRLRQVDLDGTASYSPVRTVAFSHAAMQPFSLFPNPAHDGAATLTGAQHGTVVTVYDGLGRLVTSAPADATGTAALVLPAGLAAGVYVVRAGTQALRLTVE